MKKIILVLLAMSVLGCSSEFKIRKMVARNGAMYSCYRWLNNFDQETIAYCDTYKKCEDICQQAEDEYFQRSIN